MPMQRARRLASVAVVAALGVTGLSACQQAPTVAAYLGSLGTITETRVQQVWNDAHQALEKQADATAAASKSAAKPVTMPITRTEVVTTLIADKLMNQVAVARGVTAQPGVTAAQAGQAVHLPATTEYVQLFASWNSLVSQLEAGAANAPSASDADLKQIYDALVASNAFAGQSVPPFDSFKSQLSADQKKEVDSTAAVRDEIKTTADSLHIKVNPRYQPAKLSLLTTQTQSGALVSLFDLPLGSNTATAPVSAAS
jgi:hypothetical protein